MEKFEKLTAAAAPMPASNIDTDIIMPKAFLKRIDKEGVLEGLFHDVRLYEDGREREDFVLNQPAYRNAKILVTGPNFGSALPENTLYGDWKNAASNVLSVLLLQGSSLTTAPTTVFSRLFCQRRQFLRLFKNFRTLSRRG